jgi:uncharacterized protein
VLNSLGGLNRAQLHADRVESPSGRRACGSSVRCIRNKYLQRICELEKYPRHNKAIHLLLDLLTLAFPIWKAPISHQLPQTNSLIEKTLPTNRPLTTSRTWQIGFAGSSRVWLAAEVVAVSNDVRYGDAKRPSRRKARSTI